VTECVHAPNIASLSSILDLQPTLAATASRPATPSKSKHHLPIGHPLSWLFGDAFERHYDCAAVAWYACATSACTLHCIAWCGGRTCSLCRIQSARAAWLCPSTKQLAIIGSTCHPPHTDCRHLHVQKRCSSCSTHSLWLCARRQSRAPQAARAFRTGHICHSPQAHLHPRVAACACDHSSTSRCVCEARVGRWSSAMQP
jgi:hypothetical protein